MADSLVAVEIKRLRTCAGVKVGLAATIKAATAVTCGVAIEVPSHEAYFVSSAALSAEAFIGRVERIPMPGAAIEMCDPVFENEARRLVFPTAPTATTPG